MYYGFEETGDMGLAQAELVTGVDLVPWDDGVSVAAVGEFCCSKGASIVGELSGGDCLEMPALSRGSIGGSSDPR